MVESIACVLHCHQFRAWLFKPHLGLRGIRRSGEIVPRMADQRSLTDTLERHLSILVITPEPGRVQIECRLARLINAQYEYVQDRQL
jgi:hypothetical protein